MEWLFKFNSPPFNHCNFMLLNFHFPTFVAQGRGKIIFCFWVVISLLPFTFRIVHEYAKSSRLVYQILQHAVLFCFTWMMPCVYLKKKRVSHLETGILVEGWRVISCVRKIEKERNAIISDWSVEWVYISLSLKALPRKTHQ